MNRQSPHAEVPPQIQEILRFQSSISRRTGREVSLSEAIANWIALGHADDYIDRLRDEIPH